MIRFTSVIGSKVYSFGKVTCEKTHTPDDRRNESLRVDSLASMDPIYLADAEAASEFKKLRKEYYTFQGVSQNCPVLNYPNDYLIDSSIMTITEKQHLSFSV